MERIGEKAELCLNGVPAGSVTVRGHSDSWSWGDFAPLPAYSDFAPIFSSWSLLMHVDDDARRLSRDAAQELREAEIAIDRLTAELRWEGNRPASPLRQVNIDGRLIEWKTGPAEAR